MTLLAELEAASVGSRALSDRVLLACGWEHNAGTDPQEHYWRAPDGGLYDYYDDPHASSREPIPHRPCPTTSVDAAIALVPEGWWWKLSNRGRAHGQLHNGEPRYSGADGEKNPLYKRFEVAALSPALVLCIGCLRAREMT